MGNRQITSSSQDHNGDRRTCLLEETISFVLDEMEEEFKMWKSVAKEIRRTHQYNPGLLHDMIVQTKGKLEQYIAVRLTHLFNSVTLTSLNCLLALPDFGLHLVNILSNKKKKLWNVNIQGKYIFRLQSKDDAYRPQFSSKDCLDKKSAQCTSSMHEPTPDYPMDTVHSVLSQHLAKNSSRHLNAVQHNDTLIEIFQTEIKKLKSDINRIEEEKSELLTR